MKKLIYSLVSFFFVLGTIIAVSYAWFINTEFKNPNVSGYSAAAYFAGGDGSEEKPFIITNKRHMYNLAWLQYLGKFNETDENDSKKILNQYYFEIKNTVTEIDMDGMSLPPIGTPTYPFVGIFNGNGCVIKNLTVSNNITDLQNKPKEESVTETNIKAINIVGMFGTIGNPKTTDAEGNSVSQYTTLSIVPSVSNFYLDDINISTIATNSLIGLLAGYVADQGNVANVGVHYSKFTIGNGVSKLGNFTNISNYALIGDYDSENVGWVDKPTPSTGTGGADMNFGGSLGILSMYQRMELINSNNWSTPALNVPSNIDDGSHPESGYALPLIVENDISDDYYSTHSGEITPSNNIGYYTGSGAKIYSKGTIDRLYESDITYSSTDSRIIEDINIWTKDNSTSGEQYDTLVHGKSGNTTADKIDDNIISDVLEILNDNYDAASSADRRMYGIRLNSQVSHNQPAQVQNLTVAGKTYDTVSYLPSNAVWFVPQQDGYVKIVLAVMNNGRQGFTMYEMSRNAPSMDSTASNYNPYNGTLSGVNTITNFYDSEGNLVYSDGYAREMTENRLYYYELPVKAGKEYALGQANSNGSYLIYLDVGQNAGADVGGSTTPTPTYTNNIENIDFLYLDPSTSKLSSLDDGSDVFFIVSGTATDVAEYYFRRNKDDGTMVESVIYDVVLFYPGTDTNNGLTLGYSETGDKGKATDNTCEELEGDIIEGSAASSGGSGSGSGGGSGTGGGSGEDPGGSETTTYTVTFNTNGGSSISSQTVEENALATEPTAPTLSGYTFAGWYTDSACTQAFDFSTEITGNITLYAKWNVVLSSTTYDESNYSGLLYASGTTYASAEFSAATAFDTTLKNSITLIPVSSSTAGSITLVASSDVDDRYIYLMNSDGSLSTIAVAMSKTGNTMYFTSANIINYNGVNYIGIATTDDYKVTSFTVSLSVSTYSVTFNTNGGSSVASQTVASGSTISAPDSPTKSGYQFAGWYTDSACTQAFDFSTEITGNITLYAKWAYSAEITLNTNGGTYSGDTTFTVNEDTGMIDNLSSIIPTKTDAIFLGWYTDSSFNNEAVASTVYTSNTTLYACWTYPVTFDANGGAFADSSTTLVVNPTAQTVTLPTAPTHATLSFAGWYTDSACTQTFDETIVLTEPITVYAKWSDVETTYITLNLGAATLSSGGTNNVVQVERDVDGNVDLSSLPTTIYWGTEAKTVTGWYTGIAKGSVNTQFNGGAISENTVLYPKWNTMTVIEVMMFETTSVDSITPGNNANNYQNKYVCVDASNDTQNIPLPHFELDGYTFVTYIYGHPGWGSSGDKLEDEDFTAAFFNSMVDKYLLALYVKNN